MNFFRFALLSIITFFSTFVQAQNNKEAGYVILQDGDTLHGQISYDRNNQVCLLTRSGSALQTAYNPKNLKGFQFLKGSFFESKELPEADLKTIVFMEVLVRGRATLLKFKGTYFIEKDDFFGELKNREIEGISDDGRSYMRETKEYLGILNYTLSDCTIGNLKINRTKLFQKPLTLLVEEYNRCFDGESITYNEDKPWVALTKGAGIIFSASNLTISSNASAEFLNGNYKTDFILSPGVHVELSSPRMNANLSMLFGVYYSNVRFTRYNEFTNFIGTDHFDNEIRYTELKLPLALRYRLTSDRSFQYFFNVGVTPSYVLKPEGKVIHENELSSGKVTTSRYELQELNNAQLGFIVGVGISRDIFDNRMRADLEIRYEVANGILPAVYPASERVSSLSLLMIINF